MRLLVSDANVLLDLEVGGLIGTLFALPFDCVVPDVLYHEELADQHPELLSRGLQLAELDGQAVERALEFSAAYRSVSRIDCLALALAYCEGLPLLTGDAALRTVAEQNSVVVVGTIWVMDLMVTSDQMNVATARSVYARMRSAGRRLPWDIAEQHLVNIEAGLFTLRDPFAP